MAKKSRRARRQEDDCQQANCQEDTGAHEEPSSREALDAFLHQDAAAFSWVFYPMPIAALFQTGQENVRLLRNHDVWRELGSCLGGENGLAFARGIYDEVPPLHLHIHYGLTSTQEPFWMVHRDDGESIGLVFPKDAVADCFAHLMRFIRALYSQVNSSPFSPSYCSVTPERNEILVKVRLMCPDFKSNDF